MVTALFLFDIATKNYKLFLLYVLTQADEKYIGAVVLQKTYVEDYLKGKQLKNTGELQQVLVINHHQAIVSEDMFHQINNESN